MRAIAIIACLMLTGCASGVTTIRYSLEPQANSCAATESRPSWQSNIVGVVCWDGDAKPIGMGSASGMSTAGVATSLIGATATIGAGALTFGGAMVLGQDIVKASKNLGTLSVNTTGNVTTSGSVDIGNVPNLNMNAIPNLNMNPIAPLTGTITVPPVTGNLGIVLPGMAP